MKQVGTSLWRNGFFSTHRKRWFLSETSSCWDSELAVCYLTWFVIFPDSCGCSIHWNTLWNKIMEIKYIWYYILHILHLIFCQQVCFWYFSLISWAMLRSNWYLMICFLAPANFLLCSYLYSLLLFLEIEWETRCLSYSDCSEVIYNVCV